METNLSTAAPIVGMVSTTVLWIVIPLFLVIGGAFGVMMTWGLRILRQKGKVHILWVDPDGMGYKLAYEKRNGNEIRKPEGTYLLDGGSRFTGEKSLWIIHYRHGGSLRPGADSEPGATLRPQTDQELFAASPGMRLLTIANPRAYYDAVSRNEASDALNANKEDEPWFAKLAVPILILGVCTLSVVIFVAVRMKGGSA